MINILKTPLLNLTNTAEKQITENTDLNDIDCDNRLVILTHHPLLNKHFKIQILDLYFILYSII